MSEKIRTIIVDDEALARDGVRLLLAADPDFVVETECADGFAAVEAIRSGRPDLVFLDVQMPEKSGFDVLKELPAELWPAVVFVTAFDSFAIRAFEVHALDYVLKPIDQKRFEVTLARVKAEIRNRRGAELSSRMAALLEALRRDDLAVPSRRDYLTRFTLKEGDRIYFVIAADVDWIEAADYYVQLHVGKKAHLLRDTLNRLEGQLDPKLFARIHRSTIVNTSRIRELKKHFGHEHVVVLTDGTTLRLSRGYRENLAAFLGEKT